MSDPGSTPTLHQRRWWVSKHIHMVFASNVHGTLEYAFFPTTNHSLGTVTEFLKYFILCVCV